jgi:3-deoxy-D-manno-octulosonic-acid transferase
MLIIDFIYLIYIIIVSPYYLFKFITSEYHRKGLLERFGFIPVGCSKPCLWLHASSVGEINASEILIKKLKEFYPDYELVISTLTPSAQKLVKTKYPETKSFFFPIDLSIIIRRVLKKITPALIILIEQELWLNLIRIATSQKIPLVLLNGRITKHSTRRYHFIKPIIRDIWNKVSYFCVQNKDYAGRFETLGIKQDKIKITGNMKYDGLGLSRRSQGTDRLREIFGFKNNDLVIIGGSTHHPEEEILIDVYSELKKDFSNLGLIIAPRHPFRFDEVEKVIRSYGFDVLRRSQTGEHLHPVIPVGSNGAKRSTIPNAPEWCYPSRTASGSRCDVKGSNFIRNKSQIVLLDTIGELVLVYSIADIVFVGGSLVPRGGQSILEPAALGKPVIFGTDMSNFQDIADLLMKAEAGISVKDKNELFQRIQDLVKNPARLKEIGTRAKEIITQYQGATGRNMEFIRALIKT